MPRWAEGTSHRRRGGRSGRNRFLEDAGESEGPRGAERGAICSEMLSKHKNLLTKCEEDRTGDVCLFVLLLSLIYLSITGDQGTPEILRGHLREAEVQGRDPAGNAESHPLRGTSSLPGLRPVFRAQAPGVFAGPDQCSSISISFYVFL